MRAPTGGSLLSISINDLDADGAGNGTSASLAVSVRWSEPLSIVLVRQPPRAAVQLRIDTACYRKRCCACVVSERGSSRALRRAVAAGRRGSRRVNNTRLARAQRRCAATRTYAGDGSHS